MKKPLFVVYILLSTFLNMNSKENSNEVIEQLHIEKPDNWIEINDSQLKKNFDKYELSEEQLEHTVKELDSMLVLKSIYKYNPESYVGLIPSIHIVVLRNETKDFSEFEKMVHNSVDEYKKFFSDFILIEKPKEVTISGIKSIYFVSEFSIYTEDNKVIKTRTSLYAIPNGNYFYQINFNDPEINNDNSELINQSIKSIKIG